MVIYKTDPEKIQISLFLESSKEEPHCPFIFLLKKRIILGYNMAIFDKIFGDANAKYLKNVRPLIDKINEMEADFEKLSDEGLKQKTAEFKERLTRGETLDDILVGAFATVREAARRTLRQRHFDVQLIGGVALHQGKVAEMKTGEGKTLVATLPLYLNALEGKGCHLVTINDYLARRDAVWMGQIYNFLGLSTGILNHEQSFLYDPLYKKPDEQESASGGGEPRAEDSERA